MTCHPALAVLAALAVVLGGCASSGVVVGQPAPAFRVETFGGDVVRSEDLAGKVVVLDFWASWCGPCRRTLPGLAAVADEYAGRDDVAILAVNPGLNDTRADALAFMTGAEVYPPAYWDGTGQIARAYRVRAIPALVVIGPDGVVRHTSVGGGSPEAYARKVRAEIEAALAG